MASNLVPRPPAGEIDLPRGQWKADRLAGRASLYGELANQAANMVCGLYGKSPSSFLRVIPVDGNLIDNDRPFFDDLCQDIAPPPAPPQSQFNGGQCDNVRYEITFTVALRGPAIDGVFPQPRNQTFNAFVWGKIEDISLDDYVDEVSPPFRYQGYKRLDALCYGDGGLPSSQLRDANLLGSSSGEIQSIVSLSVRRADGQPDTCGNPAPKYPPPSKDPNDYSRTVPFQISPTVQIPVDIKIVPTFPPVVGIFRPEINVNVGGINVNINTGGFTFSPSVDLPVGVSLPYGDPRADAPEGKPISNPGANGNGDLDALEILKRIRELKLEVLECCERDNPFEPPDPTRVIVTELGVGDSGMFDLPRRTFQIAVRLTQRLKNEKMQPGGTAPDVVYAGWCWFGSANNMSERMPLDSEFKLYSPKEWISQTFGFTCYTGYNARITAYSMKQKTVGD